MAQYGYSTPYTGQQVQTLPPGYMEAATAPGRNLAMGIAAMGQGLGKAIEQYRTKKAETEAAEQSRETLVGLYQQQLASDPKYLAIQQYTETGQLPQGVTEQDIPRYTQQVQADREMLNKFSNVLGEKFVDMSLAKKKAALGDAVMVLNQYRTDQSKQAETELRNLQLQQLKNQVTTQQQLGELMRYGMTMPTEVSVSDQVTETVQPVGPVQPAMQPQAAPTFNEQGYLQALKQYQQQTAPAVNAADIQAQLAQLQPLVSETPRQFRIPSLQGGMGGGLAVGQATVTETPQQVAGRIAQNLPRVQQLQAQLQAAQAKPATMPRREDFTTQPAAQQPAAQFLPPVEVTTPVTRTEQVPYEQLRRNMARFAAQQGMNPEVFASLDRVLEVAGQRKPTQIEQVGNMGAVVRFGDKEQFVPAKEANIGDMLKVRGLTIDFPEFRGTAPTEAEASKFREQYSNVLDSRKAIAELLDIAKMGAAMQQTPEVRARANSLVSGLRGIERINIIGPGTITPEDFKLLNSVIPDPTSIFSLKKSNIQAFETMLQKSARAIESRAKSIGLEVLKPDQQQPAATRSGFVRYNPLTKKLE
jgi:hypothetical protein